MGTSRGKIQQLFDHEGGQATVEYIMMLAVAVSLTLIVVNQLIRPAMDKVIQGVSDTFLKLLFRPGGIYEFPIGK